MIKLYVHKMTIRYYDYGTPLGAEHGITWTVDGDVYRTMGFERGKTIESVRAKCAAYAGQIELVVGKPITRSHDMNPRGDI